MPRFPLIAEPSDAVTGTKITLKPISIIRTFALQTETASLIS